MQDALNTSYFSTELPPQNPDNYSYDAIGNLVAEWLLMIFRSHARFNKRTGKLQFWTHESHVVELSTNEMIDSRIDYIHENPVRAGIVEKAEDYLYSSARNYSSLPALIEIDYI